MRYIHTNIIAKNWRSLSKFYQNVFGLRPIGPQRDISGKWIEDLTNIKNIHIVGEHLLFPGYNENIPTLEIFSYEHSVENQQPRNTNKKYINSYGFSHIAFEVQNVEETVEMIIKEGGSILGKIVTKDYGEMGIGTFAYARDIEENIIELQNWKK
jgi:predicted enzyme related to lactoylglutathione lyase